MNKAIELHGWAAVAFEGTPVRVLAPESLHLTLNFIGNVSGHVRDAMTRYITQANWRPMTASTGALRLFGRNAISIELRLAAENLAWLESFTSSLPTSALSNSIDARKKRRSVRPHVALARALHGWNGDLNQYRPPSLDLEFERVVLFESQLTTQGSYYTVLAESPDPVCLTNPWVTGPSFS